MAAGSDIARGRIRQRRESDARASARRFSTLVMGSDQPTKVPSLLRYAMRCRDIPRLVSLVLLASWPLHGLGETYDIVLVNGRVIDPASGRDEVAHVAIREGVIAAVSNELLLGESVLDVSGLVVAPGFIDLHAHGQHLVGQEFQVMDGVTTAIDAELGAMPLAPYYKGLEGRSYINFGVSASNQCARLLIVGGESCGGHAATRDRNPLTSVVSENRANDPRTAAMSAAQEDAVLWAMKQALADGALGFGLGLEYTPGAGRGEVYRIFESAAEMEAPVFVHVRRRQPDAAPGIGIAVVQEVIANAAVTGAPLQIVHVHSTGLDDTPVIVDMIARAQRRGLDITGEAYPYTAGSTAIGSEVFAEGWQARFNADYGDLQWADTGERLTEASFRRYRTSAPEKNVIIHMIPQRAVDAALSHPAISIASDGMPWITAGEHPRGAGTFARVLGYYVRERRVLSLMTALRKMTILPARRLEKIAPRMARKGRLQDGADADITIFDPNTIIDSATWRKPMQYSRGIRHVLVAGEFVVRDGRLVEGSRPGIAIKGRYAAGESAADNTAPGTAR